MCHDLNSGTSTLSSFFLNFNIRYYKLQIYPLMLTARSLKPIEDRRVADKI